MTALALAHLVAAPLCGALPEAVGPGWFESSWDLLSGLEVREVSLAELRYVAGGGGAEPDPPSAT